MRIQFSAATVESFAQILCDCTSQQELSSTKISTESDLIWRVLLLACCLLLVACLLLLWFVSWELDCTPVPLCFSKSEIQNPNQQTSQDL